MKRNIKIIYSLEIIIALFILIGGLFNQKLLTETYLISFFGTILLVSLFFFLFPKDKSYYKGSIIRIVIVVLLSAFILSNGLGLILGFKKSVFAWTLTSILERTIPTIFLVIIIEIIRYLIAKNAKNDKKILIIYTILIIILKLFIGINVNDFSTSEGIFKTICLVFIPTIASETLASFITYEVSLMPTIIYQLSNNLYIYLLPIIPNLGNYLNSVFLVLIPYTIYVYAQKALNYNLKDPKYTKRASNKLLFVSLTLTMVTLIILISGVFSYKMIAVGSDSMNPIYKKGDAIIYQKVEPKVVEKGDILVFQRGKTIITHRVTDITKKGSRLEFTTKGDNNDKEDSSKVSDKDALGIVKYIVTDIGYPSIWLNEKVFSRSIYEE